jgi:heterodisulfide reductase subunit C
MASDNVGTMSPFLIEILETQGGSQVLQCYQCGTCSGSCPVIDEMDYGPRRLMHLIQAGDEATVLSSKDMWRCVSCYSCANRCPRGIEITDLMADLRRLSLEKGYAHDNEAEFGLAFAETVQMHGRMFEPELLTRYYLRVLDLFSLAGLAPMGIKMLMRGKLPFLPDHVAHPEELKEIGVVDSIRLHFATGLAGRHHGAPRKLSGRVAGGLVAVSLAALLTGLRLGKGKAR